MRQGDPLHKLIDELPGEPGPDRTWVNGLEQRLRAAAAGRRRQRVYAAGWWTGGAAAAACAALLLLALLPGAEVSFAAVQQQMRDVRRVSFETHLTLEQRGTPMRISRIRSWIDHDLGVRSDVELLGQPMVQLWLPRQGRPLLVDHIHQVAMPLELPDMLQPEALLHLDPTALVRQISRYGGEVEPVPAHPDDPHVGFRIDPAALRLPAGARIELWVDRTQRLPTRIVCHVPLKGDRAVILTTDSFEWNPPSDPAQTLLAVPEEYRKIDPLVVPPPHEKAFVRTLRNYALLTGGSFPNDEMPAWQALARVLMMTLQSSANWQALPEPLQTRGAKRQALGDAIAGGLYFLRLHDADAGLEYFGDDVRLGDDAVLMRSRLPGGATRVINGNLEMETLQP